MLVKERVPVNIPLEQYGNLEAFIKDSALKGKKRKKTEIFEEALEDFFKKHGWRWYPPYRNFMWVKGIGHQQTLKCDSHDLVSITASEQQYIAIDCEERNVIGAYNDLNAAKKAAKQYAMQKMDIAFVRDSIKR